MSHAALQKYEKGVMGPDSSVLNALCRVLDLRPDFFFQDREVELVGIEFRKRKKLTKTDENRAREEAREFFERYLEVEEILEIDSPKLTPADLSGVSWEALGHELESAAAELRKTWKLGLNAIPNVHELLEENSVKVKEIETSEALDGFSGRAGDVPVVVLAKWLNRDLPRKRFTAAHELGHLYLDLPRGLDEKAGESCCHRFAGAFLLPKDRFEEAFGGDGRGSASANWSPSRRSGACPSRPSFIGRRKIYGKAMVVTSGIERAIQYKLAVDASLRERRSPYKALVAFTGEKLYQGEKHTEDGMNGFAGAKTPDEFEKDEFRFLIVAEKFQTGFDQPKRHTMYVDKELVVLHTKDGGWTRRRMERWQGGEAEWIQPSSRFRQRRQRFIPPANTRQVKDGGPHPALQRVCQQPRFQAGSRRRPLPTEHGRRRSLKPPPGGTRSKSVLDRLPRTDSPHRQRISKHRTRDGLFCGRAVPLRDAENACLAGAVRVFLEAS